MMTVRRRIRVRPAAPLVVATAFVLAGCTALTRNVLVKESGQPASAA